MSYDEVKPVVFDKIFDHPLFIKELNARSTLRVASNPEFRYVLDDLNLLKKKIADNKISLDENVRRTELAEEKSRLEKRTANREKQKKSEQTIYQITLDNADKPELELAMNDNKAEAGNEPPAAGNGDGDALENADTKSFDPVRIEALHILSDLIELSRSAKKRV